jgi:cephalosporin-C deacetylase-like acetyl esterase
VANRYFENLYIAAIRVPSVTLKCDEEDNMAAVIKGMSHGGGFGLQVVGFVCSVTLLYN